VENEKIKQTLSKWSANDVNWFAIFCKTYEERRIAKSLQKLCDIENAGKYFVFVPTKDYVHQKKGITIRKVPWLNGYVFIATTESAENCKKMAETLILNESAIFKLLSYDGTREAAPLTESDKTLFTTILNEDFHMPALKASVVDGRVEINMNPIESNGGKVVKVNKRKRSALVEMFIMGEKLKYEIALEFPADLKS
jgi:transcription antitermination factor NusG